MATTTTTVTTPAGTTTTTTTTTTPAVNADEMEPWATSCGRQRTARFTRSGIFRTMRRFVNMVQDLDALADDLIERMPESEPLNDYSGDLGQQFADDVKAAMWSIRIAADLMSSEMPYRRQRARAAKKAKAKKRKPTTPATFLPVVGVLDARTPAEREADERAGKDWPTVAAEVIAGTAEPLTAKKPHNRITGIA